jgi:hypothetical protein
VASLDRKPGSSPKLANTGVRLLIEDMDRLRVAADEEGVAIATIIRRAVVSELNRIEKGAKRAGKAK